MGGTYAGESIAKKYERFQVYEVASYVASRFSALRWKTPTVRDGHALVLCGPEAAERGLLWDYLGFPPEKTHFVDVNPDGLEIVSRENPSASISNCDVGEYISRLDPSVRFDFVHLDFMGGCSRRVLDCVGTLRHRMREGSVLAYTYLRGREQDDSEAWRMAVSAARGFIRDCNSEQGDFLQELERVHGAGSSGWYPFVEIEDSTLDDRDFVRTHGYAALISSRLFPHAPFSESPYMLAYETHYNSGVSPMGTIALLNCGDFRGHLRAYEEAQFTRDTLAFSPWASPTTRRANSDEFLRCVLGFVFFMCHDDAAKTARCLNIPVSSVIAWRAHVSRGTYANVTSQDYERWVREFFSPPPMLRKFMQFERIRDSIERSYSTLAHLLFTGASRKKNGPILPGTSQMLRPVMLTHGVCAPENEKIRSYRLAIQREIARYEPRGAMEAA